MLKNAKRRFFAVILAEKWTTEHLDAGIKLKKEGKFLKRSDKKRSIQNFVITFKFDSKKKSHANIIESNCFICIVE